MSSCRRISLAFAQASDKFFSSPLAIGATTLTCNLYLLLIAKFSELQIIAIDGVALGAVCLLIDFNYLIKNPDKRANANRFLASIADTVAPAKPAASVAPAKLPATTIKTIKVRGAR